MDPVSVDDCKRVVRETGMTYLGHHRCTICAGMVGYRFRADQSVHPDWFEKLGIASSNETVVFYDPSCDCLLRAEVRVEPRSWQSFADAFNMQSSPETRSKMWERFQKGQPTHEID